MTRDRPYRDLDAALTRWMSDEAPANVPVSVLEEAFARTMVARQARVYPWHRVVNRWRRQRGLPLMAIAATAILLVAALGFGVLGGGSGPPAISVPSPTPAPTPTRAPSATPSPSVGPSVVPGYATAPPGFATLAPLTPETPLPDPVGSPLPSELIGRVYNADPAQVQGDQATLLTLRAASDPHCLAMFGGRSTCFTILWTPNWPKHQTDPGVRGPARIVGDQLVLEFALVMFDPDCEGTSSTYAIEDGGATLSGVDVPDCSGFPRWIPH